MIVLGVAEQVVPADQVASLREALLTFLEASRLDLVDKAQSAAEFERARGLASTLPEPARTLMNYVNLRDVEHLGPILLPHVAALGGAPALSPALSPVPQAPVYLLHGSGDHVVPASETVAFARTLTERGADAHALVTPLITHAEVGRAVGVADAWALVGSGRTSFRADGLFRFLELRPRRAPFEGNDLTRRQGPEMSELEPVVGDGPDADTLELHDRVPNGIEHLAHLTVAALVYDERQNALRSGFGFVATRPETHFGFRRAAAFDHDAAARGGRAHAHPGCREPAPHTPRAPVPRMREPRRQLAVVGEEEQALAVVVEPADRIDVACRQACRAPSITVGRRSGSDRRGDVRRAAC